MTSYYNNGTDIYKDLYEVEVDSDGYLTLALEDSCPEEQIDGEARAIHTFSPKKARKLAKRLREAADIAEALG